MLRSYVVAALENVALWHERDISHSSTERMMLLDVSVTLHFMLREMTAVVQGLGVYPENMRRNMNIYGGVVFSQRVLLALVESGLNREDAIGSCNATPIRPGTTPAETSGPTWRRTQK